jgi:hypothetical protein
VSIVPGSLEDQNAVLDLSAFHASAGDPFRPQDVILPPGVSSVPPCCPLCTTLLHYVDMNAAGDFLFECLNDGYLAVYRAGSAEWEQCTSRDTSKRWAPPLTLADARRRAVSTRSQVATRG